jgi:hypothetical protein
MARVVLTIPNHKEVKMGTAIPIISDGGPRPNFKGAIGYILRIRSASKRSFAMAFFGHLKDHRVEPSWADFGIGVMAAQAVQLNLRAYMEGRL